MGYMQHYNIEYWKMSNFLFCIVMFVICKVLNEKMEKEISSMDQKLVLDLDQQVSDQQVTLEVCSQQVQLIYSNVFKGWLELVWSKL